MTKYDEVAPINARFSIEVDGMDYTYYYENMVDVMDFIETELYQCEFWTIQIMNLELGHSLYGVIDPEATDVYDWEEEGVYA